LAGIQVLLVANVENVKKQQPKRPMYPHRYLEKPRYLKGAFHKLKKKRANNPEVIALKLFVL